MQRRFRIRDTDGGEGAETRGGGEREGVQGCPVETVSDNSRLTQNVLKLIFVRKLLRVSFVLNQNFVL